MLICLGILEISLALYLTFWREHFWNAVTNKDSHEFLYQLGKFTIVALTICFVNGYSGYIVSLTAIKWREKLNTKALSLHSDEIENSRQRIQADCMDYPTLALDLMFNSTKSLVYVLVFVTSFLISFSWMLLSGLICYAILGTVLTKKLAMPLVHLNYESQRAEATYRSSLLTCNFIECISIMLGLAKKQKHLSYLQNLYGQIGVVLPLIIIAPMYFATGMSVGTLMRFNSTSSTILDNLSYGINSFGNINKWLSCSKRLKEMKVI